MTTPGRFLIAGMLMALITPLALAQPVQVNCDARDTLGQALATAQPGTTIEVSGTCTENLTITTDQITLDGQGQAQLVGKDPMRPAVVMVQGARNVLLRGFTIRNGLQGINPTTSPGSISLIYSFAWCCGCQPGMLHL